MNNLKPMMLTTGESYNFDDDCAKVMENLKQHLFNKLDGCKSVLGDLVLDPKPMMTEVATMADCLDDDDLDTLEHYLCLAGTCMRIVVYQAIRRTWDNNTPHE